MKDQPPPPPPYRCVSGSIQQHANLLLQLMLMSDTNHNNGGGSDGGREPTGNPRPLTADEAIRERQRRTRERWAAEAAQRPQTIRHEHYVHAPEAKAETPHREIIDAEIVEDTESNTTNVPAVKAGAMRALPRSTGNADDVLTAWMKGQRHGR